MLPPIHGGPESTSLRCPVLEGSTTHDLSQSIVNSVSGRKLLKLILRWRNYGLGFPLKVRRIAQIVAGLLWRTLRHDVIEV